MAQMRAWQFTVFDFTGGREILSGRYARHETISIMGGTLIKGSDILVDEEEFDDMGMTKFGFKPPLR